MDHSGNFIKRNQTRDRDSQPDNSSDLSLKFLKIKTQKSHQRFGVVVFHVLLGKNGHLTVIVFLTASVHVTGTAESADVPIELGADVVQLMKNGNELFFERQVQKPWQEKCQQIQSFLSAVVHLLHGPQTTFAAFDRGTTLKSQRCQTRLNAPLNRRACLREGDSHTLHADVLKLGMALTDVFAQRRHCLTKIEMRHVDSAPDPWDSPATF